MKTSFYISIRYFFSKKRTNLVNIIVFLSILSISVTTFSLSTILFVFSGLKDLNKKFYQNYYPDITISYSNEKNVFTDNNVVKQVRTIKEIIAYSRTTEKKVIFRYNNHEYFLFLKGVDNEYEKVMEKFKKISFKKNKFNHLNIYVEWNSMVSYFPMFFHVLDTPLQILIFDCKKNKKNILVFLFIKKKVSIKGVFHFITKMDKQYLFCDLSEFQNVMKKKFFHTLEIRIDDKANIGKVKNVLKKKLGPKFNIITREERRRVFYKILNTEKVFIYFLFTLMMLIIGFSLFSAIFILQLDKIKELFTLWNMGFSLNKIKMIFLYIGLMINIFGCLIGLFISYIVCFLQTKYKIFKIDKTIAFPVKITIEDSYMVACLILLIGSIISLFSLKRIQNMIFYYYK
ncbi:ABC transporter permease [Blattabacterium cuenoti]|uniref:ABC transporter permease n=1 Tax=Blattabacterium cuenoti TaxID=1653831 RepID=UPI00163C959B|nr:ABC transporter permease [Blattabacterium cuenoti]